MLVSVELPSVETEIDTRSNFGQDMSEVVMCLEHPSGEVNRARHMPQRPTWVATKCADSSVLLYDLEKAAQEKQTRAEASVGPALRCLGHDDEGFGLAWDPRHSGRLASGANDGNICIWELAAPVSAEVSATSIISCAHGGSPVGDVAWCPRVESRLVSVGDDKRLALWDLRASTTKPSAARADAHENDVTCVALPPARDDERGYLGYLLATGSADATVKLWDTRKLAEPLHVAQQDDEVVAIQWAPFADAVLAAASADRRIRVYDYEKIDAPKPVAKDDNDDGQDDPPELVMTHGGHKAKINDFSWNPNEEFLAASVSADNAFQVWWVSSEVYAVEDDDPNADYDFFDTLLPSPSDNTEQEGVARSAKRVKVDDST